MKQLFLPYLWACNGEKMKTASLIMLLGLFSFIQGCAVFAPKSGILVSVTSTESPAEISSITITVSKIQILPAALQDKGTAESDWITIEILAGHYTFFDLTELSGGPILIASDNVKKGEYARVRMVIEKVLVAFEDGRVVNASIPETSYAIDFDFEVRSKRGSTPVTTELVFTFDAIKSVTISENGEIVFTPVISASVIELVVP